MALTAPASFQPIAVFGPPGWSEDTGVTAQWRLEDDEPVLVSHELTDAQTYSVGGLQLEAVEVQHSVPTFGVRVSDHHATLGYSADTTTCDAVERVAADADLFLCEAAAEPGVDSPLHLNPIQAAHYASQGAARQLVLTHLWHNADAEAFRTAAAEHFDGPVEVAHDGRTFDITEH